MKPELPKTLDLQTFKQVEQFSRAVCHELAVEKHPNFATPEVIYGFATFIAAVLAAQKGQIHPQ